VCVVREESEDRAQLNRLYGSIGGYKSWADTTDRADRMANTWEAGPTGLLWHAKNKFGPDVTTEGLTPSQLKQAEAERKRWYRELTAKSLKARQRKKAQRLRTEADRLEAMAGDAVEPDGAA
jgi:hypothetical protein